MGRPLKCHSCGEPLQASQRYCVECGARTRTLPAGVRATLASIARGFRAAGAKSEGVPGGAADAATAGTASAGAEAEAQAAQKPRRTTPAKTVKGPFGVGFTIPEFELPTARAMAVAVLGLLAFGVGIGAANTGLAASPFDLVVNVFHSGGSGTPSTPPVAATPTTPATPATPMVSTAPTGTETQQTPGGGNPATGQNQGGTTPGGATTTAPAGYSNGLPPIRHVWVITLSDQSYYNTFASTGGDSYLSTSLQQVGELVPNYFSVASGNLANSIAMLSGQGPTKQTAENCPDYTAFKASKKKAANYQQVRGEGCVYPKSVPTLMSEMQKAGLTWKAYVQGQGTKLHSAPKTAAERRAAAELRSKQVAAHGLQALATKLSEREGPGALKSFDSATEAEAAVTSFDSTREAATNSGVEKDPLPATTRTRARPLPESDDVSELAATCRHPSLGSKDPFHSGSSGYATWENPVLYFQSVTDSKNCAKEDVGIDELKGDLANPAKTPNLSLIYPDPCDNGSDTECSSTAKQSGTAGADSFVQSVLGSIIDSAAYKDEGGLVIVTFDQSNQTGPLAGIRHYSCCSTPSYPNIAAETLKTGASNTYPVTETGSCSSTTTTATDTTDTNPDPTDTDTAPTDTTTTGTTTTGTTPACTSTIEQQSPCLSLGSQACSTTGGGGQVGMIAISPYITAKSFDTTDIANHYSLLYELEDLFALPKAVGNSANPGVQGALPSLFDNYTPGAS